MEAIIKLHITDCRESDWILDEYAAGKFRNLSDDGNIFILQPVGLLALCALLFQECFLRREGEAKGTALIAGGDQTSLDTESRAFLTVNELSNAKLPHGLGRFLRSKKNRKCLLSSVKQLLPYF
ncbi:MAG: hypothetical protein R3Y55_03040 [Rikenellaceae bacterium]